MTQAIFLSYASQEADVARRICDTLRAAGLEVWFDQSELRGGDAWDASIRKQIKECSLFVPIISANTNSREEGYFRLEWKLAVDRSHLMSENKAFFFPVILGDVAEPAALVPDKFRERQWTRLNDEVSINAFAGRVAKLASGGASSGKNASNGTSNNEFSNSAAISKTVAPTQVRAQFSLSTHGPNNLDPDLRRDDSSIVSVSSEQATPSIAAPSIAVLAFANRSASADDEYFSDGLADELLNVLTKIKGLRVAARTSAFSFKGKQTTVAEIGRILNVATVLEGSVRKSGNRVRISVQLVKVDDGFHLWSESYDRALDDIFAVQDDIAQSVVQELRATLLGESPARPEKLAEEIAQANRSRSDNPEALRLCMQARFLAEKRTEVDLQSAVSLCEQALAIDPDYAGVYADLARALKLLAIYGRNDPLPLWERAKVAAEAAITREPDNALAHMILAQHADIALHDRATAKRLLAQALALSPLFAEAHSAQCLRLMCERKFDLARASILEAISLDPLALINHATLALVDYAGHHYAEATEQLKAIQALNPDVWMPDLHLSRIEQCKGNQLAALEYYMSQLRKRGNVAAADFCRDKLKEAGWEGYMVAALSDRKRAGIPHTLCAYYHLVLGNIDAAFASWHAAIAACEEHVWMLTADPRFESLYDDPRYAELLKRAGFTE